MATTSKLLAAKMLLGMCLLAAIDTSAAQCSSGEFDCGDARCVPDSSRCDGKTDCRTGRDEQSCPPRPARCEWNEFTCDDGDCVPISAKCDRKYDCADKSDERRCPCKTDDFHCANGFCIPKAQRCDGTNHCQDKSDEHGCPRCGADQIRCTDGSCVRGVACDRIYDCLDGSDEADCPNCADFQFKCRSDSACVDEARRCDGRSDCADGSDEAECVSECPGDQFRCGDGTCLDGRRRCDRYPDCADRSDESNCPDSGTHNVTTVTRCRDSEFDCGDQCIDHRFRCDGEIDCQNGSDEEDCPNQCQPGEFECQSDGVCVPESRRCDRRLDCDDGSDEFDCPAPPAGTPPPGQGPSCASHEFRCRDGACVPAAYRCDGRSDCPDASDEQGCRCPSHQFTCQNGACIDSSKYCDGRYDCQDASDESSCAGSTNPPINCAPGNRPCSDGRKCIRVEQLCDGRVDCDDMSDESICAGPSDGLNLKTYPSEQEIKENIYKPDREVVFRCRDEGPLRARVHWERPGNQPLPPGSRDNNGRLEIPNIKMEHAGTYICVANGYPPSTPGAQVSVHLNVERYIPEPTRPPAACQLHQATCSNGECIGKSQVCDGRHDCTDGSDETRCSDRCEPNEFQCSNKKCILKTWRCDSDDDCGDGSDEANCATNPPGSNCAYHQFACHSGNQCIPRSYHCDIERDCIDGSDEIGCAKPVVSKPPPPMVNLHVGDTLRITCTAVGIPTPEIIWRLNWGHIPSKCKYTSVEGNGTLVCENIQVEDQGAYSCEAINIKGSTFAQPDTILIVQQDSVCRAGYFNVEARVESECIRCFCFGHSTNCKSADLFIFQFQPPFDTVKLLGVRIDPYTGVVDIRDEPIYRGAQPQLEHIGRNGVSASLSYYGELIQASVIPYFALPENYYGNQLKSYGGYLRYTVHHENRDRPLSGPDVIITGNRYTLLHESRAPPQPFTDQKMEVRLFEGEWLIKSQRAPPRTATREEIMMTLAGINNILIKMQYNEGILNTTLTDIEMDSAAIPNSGLGAASFVEECTCPTGYVGTSCERCADGYVRQESGPWLGQCYKEPTPCPPGQYNDGRQCVMCPCPHTTPSNQFGRTCHLGSDGNVICDCPPGYRGNRCEQCDTGYVGNPLIIGDSCRPDRNICNTDGSYEGTPDANGQCRCKDLTTGPTCERCKDNSFHLSSKNQFGCINCFCMGITDQCTSSNWYRNAISSVFTTSTGDFKLVDFYDRQRQISDGLRINQANRELTYSNFPTRSVYYWSLPNRYLGDKVTSYGGNLRYTIRHTPAPGGASSRNSAADVELVSENNVNLLYYSREQVQPTNAPQTFVVPLLEQHWQRSDGQRADREHLLMALADLSAIYIKATYYTNTMESSLIEVSLDIATERNNGFSERALEVEQCNCSRGYTGTSCENCDVGYTRSNEGLYLGLCIPCACNGHSNECDPETGVCINCRDYTHGDDCAQCLPGYTGDPTSGVPCRYSGGPEPCQCDPRGSLSSSCRNGICACKPNVEGDACNHCKPGTFALSANNSDGCEVCFCSGVASECSESNLYVDQIPLFIMEGHNFSLTQHVFNGPTPRITDNFEVKISTNEIGYNFLPSNRERLYWSLPPTFTGNQILSYGGRLEFKQRFTQRPHATYIPDQDVVITGNGITLYWTNPVELRPEIANSISVRLDKNAGWNRLDRFHGPKPASREDILTVLANIDLILIRATQSSDTASAYLSDITLDTAVNTYTGQRVSTVEICRCPVGYTGTSCESCSPGYYRDFYFDNTKPLGSCTRCNCNGHEQSCSMGQNRRVICNCQYGWTGSQCEIPGTIPPVQTTLRPPPTNVTIDVVIEQNNITIYEVGSTLRLNCSARSRVSPRTVEVHWSKYGSELPNHAIDDGRGLLVITNLRISDSGRYICEAQDGHSIVTESIDVTIGEPPRAVISPPLVAVKEGDVIEVTCAASGVPTPDFRLLRLGDQLLNPVHRFNYGIFRIDNALDSDSGRYRCIASNEFGSDSVEFDVRVVTAEYLQVSVEPTTYRGQAGETVVLRCRANSNIQSIRWMYRGGNVPYNSREENGVLTIYNARAEDSGEYTCVVTSPSGSRGNRTAVVYIESRADGTYPSVTVSPERSTVSQGKSLELRCDATGYPPPTVKWIKVNSDKLSSNAEQIGNILYIKNIQPEDRGVYVCVATSAVGSRQASAVLEVTRLEVPRIEIYPETTQVVNLGSSAILQCRLTAGIPSPTVVWSRSNNMPLSRNVEEMSGGTLRFMQITMNEEGEYICTAENEAGRATAVASIVVHTPPELVINPNEEVVTRNPGERLLLECRGRGVPQPSVLWSKWGEKQYSQSLGFADAVVSASTYAVQEFHSLSKEDEGLYICMGSNSAGVTEKRIQLYVDRLPQRGDITGEDATSDPTYRDNKAPRTYDEEFTAPVGTRAELRCKISDDRQQIFIQWLRADNASLPPSAFASGETLYIDNVQPSAAGIYKCLGTTSTGTTLFTITTHLQVVSPPRITLEPSRQIVKTGSNAYIDCRATGEQPITIWWSPLDRAMPASVYTRDGFLRFNSIQPQDSGRYRCTAKNNAGEADAVAEVIVESNVISRPSITAERRLQSAPLGTTLNLSCKADSPFQNNQIRWFRDRQPLPTNSIIDREVLSIKNIQYKDEGRYYCEIASDSGSATDYIDVQVISSPTVKTLPSPSAGQPDLFISPPEEERRVGETVDVTCQSNEPGAIITWKKESDWLRENVLTRGGQLRISNLKMENGGIYRCEASGRHGVYHKDYQLYVIDDEVQDEIPLEVKTAATGSSVILVCNTDLEEPVSYIWSKQGGHLPQYVNIYDKSIQLNNIGSMEAGTYICSASSGARTLDVPIILVVTGIVPYFTQAPNSYITFPTLADSYIQFSLEISLKPENVHGLVLYNGNRGNERNGDFISLTLDSLVPVFKINLGHSTTTLRADEPISEREWHTIKIIRHRKKVSMYVDGKGPYTTEADGKYIGLDLSESLFLGGVPDYNKISPDVNVYNGFVGCISRFKIGHSHRDILKDALNKTGITTCETCSENKCENQGACQEALSKEGYTCICPVGFSGPTCNKLKGEACSPYACGIGKCVDTESGFECQCPLGRVGKRCEREIMINEPAFSNDAYLAFPPPKPARRMKITLKFKPNDDKDGILLYCGETEEGHGDFMSLAIKDRHLEFRFNSGTSPIVVRSEEIVSPGKWSIVTAIKSTIDGRLTFDGNAPSIERITSNHKMLNLQTPLYIGGVDKYKIKVHEGVNVLKGFNGCISDINVSGMDTRIVTNITDSSNVEECNPDDIDNNIYYAQEDPLNPTSYDNKLTGCSSNPCLNKGECYPTSPMDYDCSCPPGFYGKNCENSEDLCNQMPCKNQGTCRGNSTQFVCDCILGFTGVTCEQRSELRNDAHFNGNGYLEFSKQLLSSNRIDETEIIALELSTNKSDGLIFWHGQRPQEDGQGKDYVSLALSGGYLEYSFDLGRGPAIIQNHKIRVDDGERHNVILKRTGTQGSIEIDHTYMEQGETVGTLDTLDCQGNIYLGGVPNIGLMTGNRFTQGFDGCIHGFELQDSKTLDLGIKAINGINVKPCSSFLDSYNLLDNELIN